MKIFIHLFVITILTSFSLAGCGGDSDSKPNSINCDDPNLTKAQWEEGRCLWDMGEPTDRSKNQGF